MIYTNDYHGGFAARERVTIEHPSIARVRVTLGAGPDTAAIDNLSFKTPTDAPDLVLTHLEAPVIARQLKDGLNDPRPAPGGGWEFTFKGVLGHTYRLEASDDLETWTLIRTFPAETRYSTQTDPGPTERTQRFYRAVDAN